MGNTSTANGDSHAPINMVVIISGSGSNLQAIIDQIAGNVLNARIAAVISNKADAYGLVRAEKHNLSTEVIDHTAFDQRQGFDDMLSSVIDLYLPDLIVLAGFMRILTPEFVNRYHGKMINIHPSLLPKHKGINTHQRALDAGDQEHGCTIHFVTEELDGGPMIMQGSLAIKPDETVEHLSNRVQQIEHIAYPAVVNLFAERRIRLEQNTVILDGEPLKEPIIYQHQ